MSIQCSCLCMSGIAFQTAPPLAEPGLGPPAERNATSPHGLPLAIANL